jgi:hypothetical protein
MAQITKSKSRRKAQIKNVITIHIIIPKINPPIPSPPSKLGVIKLFESFGMRMPFISLATVFISFVIEIPLYKPKERKEKSARNKILTETIELSMLELLWLEP